LIYELTVKAEQLVNMLDMRLEQDAVDDEDLLTSIQEHGIKDALTCRYTSDPAIFEIVDGRRRFRVGQVAGLTEFRVTAEEMTDLQAYSVAFMKNHHRKSMSEVEEALWLKHMTEKFELTQKQLAEKVSVNVSTINRRIKFADEVSQLSVEQRRVVKTERQVRELRKMSPEKKQEVLDAATRTGTLPSARALEQMAIISQDPREVIEKWKHNEDEFVVFMLTEQCGMTVTEAGVYLKKFRSKKHPWQKRKTLDEVTRFPDGDPRAQMYAELGKWYPLEIIDAIELVAPAKTIGTWQSNARTFIRELYQKTPANTKTLLQEMFL